MKREPEVAPLAIADRYFSRNVPFARFVLNTLLVSCAGLGLFVIFYISLTPGFWQSLADDPVARGYLLRQIATNGLPVVYLINHVAFALYAGIVRQNTVDRGALRAIAIDVPTRIALFFLGHAMIFAASARLFGSFGGDAVLALSVVAPTIAGAASFGNLSGAYLYATAISAYPLFVAAVRELAQTRQATFSFLSDDRVGMGWLTIIFAVYFVVLALAVSGLASLLDLLPAIRP